MQIYMQMIRGPAYLEILPSSLFDQQRHLRQHPCVKLQVKWVLPGHLGGSLGKERFRVLPSTSHLDLIEFKIYLHDTRFHSIPA